MGVVIGCDARRRGATRIQAFGRRRLRSGHAPTATLELNLATARLVIAVILLAGELIAEPTRGGITVTGTYAAVAVCALLLLRRASPAPAALGRALPAVDLVAAVVLTLVSELPVVHFFPLFVLVSTAYRSGVAQTVAAGVFLAALLALEAHPSFENVFGRPAVPSHIFVLAGYTLVAAVLIGHLAQRERGVRSESLALGRLLEHLRLDDGPVASIRKLLEEFRTTFGARQVLLAVDDTANELALVWRTRASAGAAQRGPVVERLGAAGRTRFWFPTASFSGACLLASRPGEVMRVEAAVDDSGDVVASPAMSPEAFVAAHPASRILLLPHLAVGAFRLRLFVLDPQVERADARLQLLQTLARRFAPVVHNLYLERQLRTRLQENERARLARELHDGVIQSLIAVEIRLDVARRQMDSSPAAATADLAEAQRQLREQIVDVRTLMTQLRPPDVDRKRFIQRLSDATERFGQTTGIEARFVNGAEPLGLPARVCGELARVVDEALVNVRKHSGARRVDVRFGASPGGLTLSVEDDGRGFGFDGRLTQSDLGERGLGPVVIKERVHALGGRVAIDSSPGRGSRLEVQVPRPALG
jgi:signal transduction histidine kinase